MSSGMRTYFRRLAEGYENGWRAGLLKPFMGLASSIYQQVVEGKAKKFTEKKAGAVKLPFPVISIGNLTWGGTGKTPLVEYVVRRLSDQQKTPLVLTRGYSHDETVQFHHHLPKAVIGVGPNRAAVALEMAKKNPVDVAVLDDGFQHWKLERNLDIVLVNALNPFGNEKLIPQGILREPLSALRRASVLVISHVNLIPAEELKKLKIRLAELAPQAAVVEGFLEALFFYRAKNRDRVVLQKLQNQKVTTFSGVGTPISFHRLLSSLEIKPALNFDYTDHHPFTEKELFEIKQASTAKGSIEVITTEKDFYRSPQLITQILNPLILATRFKIRSGEELLNQKLFSALGASRR